MSEPWPAGRAAPGDGGADRTGPDAGQLGPGPGRTGPSGGPGIGSGGGPGIGSGSAFLPGSGDSPLRGVEYSGPAECLWRWVPAPADAAVRTFLTGYSHLPAAGRRRSRAELSPDDLYTLLTFARRRALAAIRTGDRAEVLAAFDAFAAIELHRIDWRDVWVSTALASYAAERLGLAPPEAVRVAANRADPELAALLAEVTRDSVNLAEECGYRVLETPTGRVLVDDEGGRYAPTADLAGLAFEAAGMLERDGYRVGQVSVAATLPTDRLGGERAASASAAASVAAASTSASVAAVSASAVSAALRGLTGCVYLHAEPEGPAVAADQQFLLLFLAEAATDQDAVTIAEATTSRAPATIAEAATGQGAAPIAETALGTSARDAAGWGLAAGRLCAVLVARSTVSGVRPAEDPASLARFGPRLTAILSGGTASVD